MSRIRFVRVFGALAAAATLALTGCSGDKAKDASSSGSPSAASSSSSTSNGEKKPGEGLHIFATTGYIGDAVQEIAPGADVFTLVKPGGDPHTYKPSTGDIEKLQKADFVFWNGLHLEALMTDQIESLGDKQLAVGEQLPKDLLLPWPEKDDKGNDLHDPHIWNSPENWQIVVDVIAKKLGEIDSANKAAYEANAKAFNAKIAKADAEAKAVFDKIPAAERVLITGHDAFNYLGKRYGIEVHATDFVTSEAQISATELKELAELITKKHVHVIFQDNLKNPQAIKSVQDAVKAAGGQVEISDQELFADSLGDTDDSNTYLKVFKHNFEAISKALLAGK